MSDPGREQGDPIEDRPADEDVVLSANESLAEAEAAQREIDDEDARFAAYAASTDDAADPYDGHADEPADEPAVGQPYADATVDDTVADETVVETTVVDEPAPAAWQEQPGNREEVVEEVVAATPAADVAASDSVPTAAYAGSVTTETPDEQPTTAYAPPVTPSEPVGMAAPVPQPIFVQAPEEPRPRGNRAATGGIGVLAAVSFAVLYLAAYLAIGLIVGDFTWDGLAEPVVAALTSWWLWIATAVFFLGFWLFGAIINRGRWGYWVIWGLLMGLVGYGAHVVGWLFEAPFWQLTRTEGADYVIAQLVAPLAFVAFVIARELTIWFGAWAAARGRRVEELNTEARREYERTLEAGPQLMRP